MIKNETDIRKLRADDLLAVCVGLGIKMDDPQALPDQSMIDRVVSEVNGNQARIEGLSIFVGKSTQTIYEKIFERLQILGVLDVREHRKLERGGLMALNIDRTDSNRFALAHNFIQNGDVMADPDMVVEVNMERRTAEALTFQQDSLGVYHSVYHYDDGINRSGVNRALKKDLNLFLLQWLRNLILSGYHLGRPEAA